MSRVHDAMRNLEHKSAPENGSGVALGNLVGALIEELADEVPDDQRLETVRADLIAASRSFEAGKKKDLALRFYLATRSLLREYELLHERLKKAEKKNHVTEIENTDSAPAPAAEGSPEIHALAATAGSGSD